MRTPLALFALAAPLALTGCQKIKAIFDALPDLDEHLPSLSFGGIEVTELSFEGLSVDFLFHLDNPHPFSLTLDRLSYEVDLAGARLLEGSQDQGITMEATGSSDVRLPASFTFSEVFELAGALKGKDEVGFQIAGAFGVDTPVGPLDLPYQFDGALPVAHAPRFQLDGFRVGEVNLRGLTAGLEIDLEVSNDHGATVGFSGFQYDLSLSGNGVADGSIRSLESVAAGASRVVTLPVDISLRGLGSALIDTLVNKEPVDLGLAAEVTVETPLGDLPLAVDETVRLRAQ